MAMKKLNLAEGKMESLCEELVAEIFDRVPIKSLTRMKCVSKDWCRLVSHYRQSRRRTSTWTSFCQYTTKLSPDHPTIADESNAIFLDTEERGGEIVCVERKSLGFSVDRDIYFVGSTNGLLLCCKFRFAQGMPHFRLNNSEIFPYVCNPVLNQWIPLPPVRRTGYKRYFTGIGLAFNGVPAPHLHFQVVWYSFFRSKRPRRYMNFHVFSSHTGNWKKRKARFLNSSPGVVDDQHSHYSEVYGSPRYLFQRGALHWILPQYMLVYHLEKKFVKLIPLPEGHRVMWESEGCLHLSSVDREGINIWGYVHGSVDNDPTADVEEEDDDHRKRTTFNANWQLKFKVEFATLKPQYSSTIIENFWPPGGIRKQVQFLPCGFDEDLQVLYLVRRGVIACYSLETRRLKQVREITGVLPSILVYVTGHYEYFSMQLRRMNLAVGGGCISLLQQANRDDPQNTKRPHLVLEPS